MQTNIQTIRDLNIFVARQGASTPQDIVKKLSDSKIIVNHSIAELIAKAYASQFKKSSIEYLV